MILATLSPKIGATGFFFAKRALSLLFPYDAPTSCQKAKKSLEPLLRIVTCSSHRSQLQLSDANSINRKLAFCKKTRWKILLTYIFSYLGWPSHTHFVWEKLTTWTNPRPPNFGELNGNNSYFWVLGHFQRAGTSPKIKITEKWKKCRGYSSTVPRKPYTFGGSWVIITFPGGTYIYHLPNYFFIHWNFIFQTHKWLVSDSFLRMLGSKILNLVNGEKSLWLSQFRLESYPALAYLILLPYCMSGCNVIDL